MRSVLKLLVACTVLLPAWCLGVLLVLWALLGMVVAVWLGMGMWLEVADVAWVTLVAADMPLQALQQSHRP